MNRTVKNVSVAVIGVLSIAAFWPGRDVGVSAQRELLGVLLNVASVVLGITGIWAGVVFPESLKRLLSRGGEPVDPRKTALANHLFSSIKLSAVVVAASLLMGPLVEVARQWDWATQNYYWLRGVLFSGLVLSTLGELLALLMALGFGGMLTDSNNQPTSGGDPNSGPRHLRGKLAQGDPQTPIAERRSPAGHV